MLEIFVVEFREESGSAVAIFILKYIKDSHGDIKRLNIEFMPETVSYNFE